MAIAVRRRMPATNSFRDLEVWREAMVLVEDVYRLSRIFPADERFGLTALNHLDIALGSQGEVDVQLEIARRLGYLNPGEHRKVASRIAQVGRMLNGLIESLQPIEEDWN